MNKIIPFTPDILLYPSQAPEDVQVKGQSPALSYSFTLRDLYPTIPSLAPLAAYQAIIHELKKADGVMEAVLHLRPALSLPNPENHSSASELLGLLFNPRLYTVERIQSLLSTHHQATLFLPPQHPLPFSFQQASPAKLLHTLTWIDTNIKVSLETALLPLNASKGCIQQLAESALRIYSILIKHDDYLLARSINFNHSMFIQDRILNLVLGDPVYQNANQWNERGKVANQIALEFIKNLDGLNYSHLIGLSIFMGVIWTSQKELQASFKTHPEQTLSQIDSLLQNKLLKWGVNHSDQLFNAVGVIQPVQIVVVLDDNGESVFDLALFQKLIEDNPNLKVRFVVNRYPVSVNIGLETFNDLLGDPYFKNLRAALHEKRASLLLESQLFRSFEIQYLQQATRQAIDQAQILYIKGANFFETFQFANKDRYHCFVVHGPTSRLLTGYEEDCGVLAHLTAGQPGFVYDAPTQMRSLKQLLLAER